MVQSAISSASGATADIQLEPGDVLTLGNDIDDDSQEEPIGILALATPGHTNGCLSFLLLPDFSRVFTGDCLLVRGCGRTDFQEGSSETMYRSVHTQLFSLPNTTTVFPGHDYRGHSCSTIGEERTHNPRLGVVAANVTTNTTTTNTTNTTTTFPTLQEFNTTMANLKLSKPKKIDVAVPKNMVCGI